MPILRRILPIMHRVAILALDAVVSPDMAIPAQVFGAYPELPYRATLCAPTPGPVQTTAGFEVVAEGGLRTVSRADTVIVPGFEPHRPPPPHGGRGQQVGPGVPPQQGGAGEVTRGWALERLDEEGTVREMVPRAP